MSTSYDTYDVSEPWRLAQKQYDYFSNVSNGYINGDTIKITSVVEMEGAVEKFNIQKGDLMYFINEAGEVHHATIISKVEAGNIYYSGNTKRRYNYQLMDSFEDGAEGVYVIQIKDELLRKEVVGGDCE